MAKKKFYAYYIESLEKSGIVNTWDECKNIVTGYKAKYKGFPTKQEAEKWLEYGANYNCKKHLELEDGIYFDAGTGRGIGVEVRVTDKNGKSLVSKVVPPDKVNKYGNYLTEDGSTNNFGELLGCFIALKLAKQTGEKKIFGDSKLILEYWSKGAIKRTELPDKTVQLADMVIKMRKEFERSGGVVSHISGDNNPSDLGFHK